MRIRILTLTGGIRGRSEAAMVKIRNLASDKVIRVELDDATVASCRIES
jgi:hypothetical protein